MSKRMQQSRELKSRMVEPIHQQAYQMQAGALLRQCCFLVAVAYISPAWADAITGRVVGVTVSDTITVLDTSRQEHKIRLDGIDAPERGQALGEKLKQSLRDLVYGKTVEVETHNSDRYGRRVGKVLLQGRDVNLEQVTRGLAWHYRAYAHEQTPQDQKQCAAAEDTAREAKIGL